MGLVHFFGQFSIICKAASDDRSLLGKAFAIPLSRSSTSETSRLTETLSEEVNKAKECL